MPIAAIKKKKIVEVCMQNDIEFCGIFGSVARGESTDESDIDLLVRFATPKSLLGRIGVEHQFEDALGSEVDLITEKELSPHIRENVMRDLKVLYGA